MFSISHLPAFTTHTYPPFLSSRDHPRIIMNLRAHVHISMLPSALCAKSGHNQRDVSDLRRTAAYFRSYLNGSEACDDIDISVHCDIQIFQWLIKYLNGNRKAVLRA